MFDRQQYKVPCAKMLDSLTTTQRSVVTLLASGVTRAEVARRRGIKAQAVKKIVQRAGKRISKLMTPEQRGHYRRIGPTKATSVSLRSLSLEFPDSI